MRNQASIENFSSYDELTKITTCESFPEGNLIKWNASNWEPKNPWSNKESVSAVRIVDVELSEFCPTNSRYIYFPGQNAADYYTMENFCDKFGGMVYNSTTEIQLGNEKNNINGNSKIYFPVQS